MINKHAGRSMFLTLFVLAIIGLSGCSSKPADAPAASSPTSSTPAKPAAMAVPALLQKADELYAQREDVAKVRESLSLLRQARASEPANYEAMWRLAKFNYYLGAHAKDDPERDKAFKDGIEAGEEAIKLQGEKPEGHFWLGANLGGRAQSSVLSGVADTDTIRQHMQAVIRVDEGYQSGSAYMVLGQIDLETPKIMGGDKQQAVKNLEKGLQFGGDNATLRLRLAQAYLATDRKGDARKQLDTILSMKPNPDFVPEYKEVVTEAKKILAEEFPN